MNRIIKKNFFIYMNELVRIITALLMIKKVVNGSKHNFTR